jgi:hypothetical protein
MAAWNIRWCAGGSTVHDEGGRRVAYIRPADRSMDRDEVKAYTHLIAAAPELYEAARLFVEEYDAPEDDDGVAMMLSYNRALEAGKSALAKARGEQVSS